MLVGVGWWALVACGDPVFGCTDHAQCEGAGGVCADPGFCAFDDTDCESGLAYGELAGGTLAGACVPPSVGTGSSTAASTSAGSASMSGDTTAAPPATSSGSSTVDGTTMGVDPTADGSTSTTGASTTGDGSSSDGGPSTQTVTYPATHAACVMLDLMTPEPGTCVSFTPPDGMTTDLVISSMMPELGGSASLVHIPVGGEFAGRDIVEVRLRLHTLPMTDSPQTGEVWAVESFTPMSIETVLPAQVGAAPLAPDMGASLGDVDVVWVLPNDAVTPNADAYLGIFPIDTDGVDFYSHLGPSPPVIEVEYLVP